MSNPAFPDLLKIGKSKKDPTQDRVSELNQTGVPEPFRVEYYAFVENEDALEALAHKHFSAKRPNKKREFFSVDCAVAINTIRDLAVKHSSIKFEEVFYVSPEELEAQRLDQLATEAKARQERVDAERTEAEHQKVLARVEAQRQEALEIAEKKKNKLFLLFHSAGAALFISYIFFTSPEEGLLVRTLVSIYLGTIVYGLIAVFIWGVIKNVWQLSKKAKASFEKAIQTYRRIVTKKQ